MKLFFSGLLALCCVPAVVAQEAVDLCDGAIEIPQLGTKHSLNVSVSGGVVLWDFFCRFRSKM